MHIQLAHRKKRVSCISANFISKCDNTPAAGAKKGPLLFDHKFVQISKMTPTWAGYLVNQLTNEAT